MCTTVFREWKQRDGGRTMVATVYGELFDRNPDVDLVVNQCRVIKSGRFTEGISWLRLGYADYDADTDADIPPPEHILGRICRVAGLRGAVSLRPYLYLSDNERSEGRVAKRQIAMQTSGIAAAHSMRNKEWYLSRFQEVCDSLCQDFTILQVGSKQDPELKRAVDLRGKTTLRGTAAILANSKLFIGQVGGLMHLARAVDCRGVIIYGGREHPHQSGYIANENLYTDLPCSPCWLRNDCEHNRECMSRITSDKVLAAAQRQLKKETAPLEIQTMILDS
jgi:ADP-heptose:LPS heptosyltransferase